MLQQIPKKERAQSNHIFMSLLATAKLEGLYKDVSWLTEFIPKAMQMLEKQESKIIILSNFSPIK